jgi:hypothetical protein
MMEALTRIHHISKLNPLRLRNLHNDLTLTKPHKIKNIEVRLNALTSWSNVYTHTSPLSTTNQNQYTPTGPA